jgi:hypothetical protein
VRSAAPSLERFHRRGTEATIATRRQDEFGNTFESAFAQFQVAVEAAVASKADWPDKAAAAIAATLEFASAHPEEARTLTSQALGRGPDGITRHERVIAYAASRLASGRALRPENTQLPEVTEHALVGGLVMLVAQRLEQGRSSDLPKEAPEMIEFLLTPYLGATEARRIATST